MSAAAATVASICLGLLSRAKNLVFATSFLYKFKGTVWRNLAVILWRSMVFLAVGRRGVELSPQGLKFFNRVVEIVVVVLVGAKLLILTHWKSKIFIKSYYNFAIKDKH